MRITKLLLLAIVAGAFVFVGCGGGDDAQSNLEQAAEDVAEKAEEVKEGAEDVAEDVKEGVKETAEDVKEGIAGKVDEAKDLVDLANKMCPACGMKLEGEHAALEYAGKKIGVCGDHCKEAFMKDPEKHLAKLTKGTLTK